MGRDLDHGMPPPSMGWLASGIPAGSASRWIRSFDALEGAAAQIAALDKELERPAREVHPATVLLRQAGRIGPHTGLRFV